jgi:transmembrane sensor
MISKDEQIRAAVAEQAADWFVADDAGPLDARESAALVAWLKTSPVNVEEFLGVTVIARDLREAYDDPDHSVEALLARALAEDDVRPFGPRVLAVVRDAFSVRLGLTAAVTMAALGMLSFALFSLWNLRLNTHVPAPAAATVLRFETSHGEQQTHRLADNSVLHLNTDSGVTIRYSKTERLAVLTSGEADFEVAHEPDRTFRVFAGSAEVVDLATKFDVRLVKDTTVVTVVEGRVAVRPSPRRVSGGADSSDSHAPRFVQLGANEQISVTDGKWPVAPRAVDAQRATAWLRREIVFDHEPLERVAVEFNRYAARPIEITSPQLRNLQISGVFSTDDTEEFIAFLRSLEGVSVDVTATRIRVSQK